MTATRRAVKVPKPPWKHWVYDIETYPNCFSLGAICAETGEELVFEISERVDQGPQLANWLWSLRTQRARMVGFNNIAFDYPVIHTMLKTSMDYQTAYRKCQSIIEGGFKNRFANIVWESDMLIPQVDLLKIHHFDNRAKSTSLKALEFAMKMDDIRDLPYAPGTNLTDPQMSELVSYMMHDIRATVLFFKESKPLVDFRDELTEKYGRDHTNFNDTKIGKEYFISQLEKSGVPCYDRSTGRREVRQTPRTEPFTVDLLPCITFSDPQLKRVYDYFKTKRILDTKETLEFPPTPQTRPHTGNIRLDKSLARTPLPPAPGGPVCAQIGGIQLDYGLGGLHGSVKGKWYETNGTHTIVDVDVTSYYPSIPIVHRIFPEHLSERFCDIYADVKKQRVGFAKGTPENAMLKLALNGVYGDSNNKYSPFYDPRYTMSVTINGQLMLSMLAEWVSQIPGLSLIQANTDGITAYVPNDYRVMFDTVCGQWEKRTGMDLEYLTYKKMIIRDVNNYISITMDGKTKQKGAYVTNPEWHKNHSSLVIQKAAVEHWKTGKPVRDIIAHHGVLHDFMICTKVRRSDKILWDGKERQKICRYYVCKTGGAEMRVMRPMTDKQRIQAQESFKKNLDIVQNTPMDKRKYKYFSKAVDEAEKLRKKLEDDASGSVVAGGANVQLCNHMNDAVEMIDLDFYVREANKLVEGIEKHV